MEFVHSCQLIMATSMDRSDDAQYFKCYIQTVCNSKAAESFHICTTPQKKLSHAARKVTKNIFVNHYSAR